MRPLLFGAVFFFACSLSVHANSTLKIALLDTGFCPDKALILSKKHKIKIALDMTDSVVVDCKKIKDKDLKSSGRFHGQQVLNEFLSFLPKDVSVSIYPLIIYDRTGTQTEMAWKKSLKFIVDEKMDLILTASGLIGGSKLVEDLPGVWFVPAGRTERMIDKMTSLFPQNLAPKPNLFLIGDYFDGKQIIYDQALLYQDQIDYYFPSGSKNFKGTSRAVAHAMGRAIKECFIQKDIIAAHSLRLCLMKKEKILKDPILKKDFKTF